MHCSAMRLLLPTGLFAIACSSASADPPPPAPKYGLMVAPPGALGASAATHQPFGVATPAFDDAEESDAEEPNPEPPSPNVAPEEGIPL